MGPKKKDKKKKEKEEKPKITKSQYLAKIAESNAALAQARKKIQSIEDAYFDTEKKYEQYKEDVVDIIKYLDHEIEENEEEIEGFNLKIAAYKKEMQDNDKYYESIFAKMESEFEEKQTSLQYQIQQINAKLFASEELRQQREEYLKKKKELEQQLQVLEARYAEEIYKAEKQTIIKQDTMQKEMETHLTTLATDFRKATDITIGETTNKLIRENISLVNTLTCMQEIIENARDSYRKAAAVEKSLKHNADLLDDEYSFIVEKYSKGVDEIETLLRSHEELTERISNSQKLIKENRRLQRDILENECILREKTEELNDLLRTEEESEEAFNVVKNVFHTLKNNFVKLETALFETAKKVKEGVDIENLKKLDDEDIPVDMDKETQEENLKEFKYKVRVTAIEEALLKLSKGLLSDTEMQLVAPSSDSYLASGQGSALSEVGAIRSGDLSTKLPTKS